MLVYKSIKNMILDESETTVIHIIFRRDLIEKKKCNLIDL